MNLSNVNRRGLLRGFSIRLLCGCFCVTAAGPLRAEEQPVRLGIVGMVHGHVHGFLRELVDADSVELVGVVEPDQDLAKNYFERFDLPMQLHFVELTEMLDRQKPDAIALFTSTFDHLRAVQEAAPRNVDVMMEKPLAVNMQHATAMAAAAKAHDIKVFVDYETTWYPSNHHAYQLLNEKKQIGDARKFVVHDGHPGPVKIRVGPEFLRWLVDPVQNGGGAVTDFGCYGANLITWMMNNQRPLAVSAMTQTIQPELYHNVDDEATIMVQYPNAQGIIQASWNWPFSRKDMEVYGETGYVIAVNRDTVRVRLPNENESQSRLATLKPPYDSSINFLAAVVRDEIQPTGLSSLENNLIVTEILDAAKESARAGRTVSLKR